ncbi:MAG: hypothetical protein Q9187_002482 [Circinaria calcarea]
MLQLRVLNTLLYLLLLFSSLLDSSSAYAYLSHQEVLSDPQSARCDPFTPTPEHPIPRKLPLSIDPKVNYYKHYVNGSRYGAYRRSSCPAVNMLANRGYINRSGRNITVAELTKAFIDVFNFGIDQIVTVVCPNFAVHRRPIGIDLDQFNDDKAQHVVNGPAAPTRNDRELGENVNINMTLFNSLVSFSKDGVTLTPEDLAEHHHLRHNQSKRENPKFRFSNRDAVTALVQYSNLIGTFGRYGPNGPTTLFLEDVRTFYLAEDLPTAYQRRELPFYSPEANAYMDRMIEHIGFKIERPFPPNDADGRDVEPEKAKYEM